jgi:alpha-amylase/alpha-mannosidase (GH57 family)
MSARLPVVLFWHMHQPQYKDALTGQYTLPWTYLHAIKDYTDMAAHLEANPAARAVVNFTPVLLEQVEEIARRIRCRSTPRSA